MRRSAWSGVAAAALAVALTTVAIYPLKTVAPAVAMGVLYLIGVLAVAIWWGLRLGLLTAVGSAAAFNYFHIPPTGRVTVASSEDAVALGAYLCSAVVAAVVAARAGEAERRRAEAELKTTVLRTVSHDFRTPLTSIITAGHALGSPSLEPGEREALQGSVVDEATRLSGLVDNLLDLSRLQAGAASPRTDWVAVDDVVRTAVECAGLPVELRLAPDLPLLRADAAQLERAFANLLENAHRHGAEPVTVSARAEGGRLEVRFADSGPGIPSGMEVFDAFTRADGPASGSGLGLAIVKGFVEANGGAVHAESPAAGAVFVVEFPLP